LNASTIKPDVHFYGPVHPYLKSVLDLSFGQEVWNLCWLSLERTKTGYDLHGRNASAVKAAWETGAMMNAPVPRANPFIAPYDRNIFSLMRGPATDFAEWLNNLDPAYRSTLPLYQHYGPAWVTRVNERAPQAAVAEIDVSEASSFLSKFRV
jgi:hypothetical protein